MNRTALLCLLVATSAVSIADPLHKYGDQGAWCHVDSGWMFPQEVGGFARVLQPYNIDGNNDAGAEYRHESLQSVVEVDVYAADTAAMEANIDGAKAAAASKAGEGARVESEQPFTVSTAPGLDGVKVKYSTSHEQTNLYYFTTDRWRVKVLARAKASGERADKSLDAFVQALPWNTLGTNPGIH